jgi:PAS domain S-box-containing protein
MKNLYSFVGGAKFIIALSDHQGCILEIFGNEQIRSSVEIGRFVPGAKWSEDLAGNNGIGTTLFVDKPIQIWGREHFRLAAHDWACSGAPIHDPHGRLLGALVITGPCAEVHTHTLGMVVTAVSAIETQVKLEETLSSLELSNNYKNAIIESISEGLLAVDEEGKISQINSIAAYYFGTSPQEALNAKCEDVFGEKNSELNKSLDKLIKSNMHVTDHEVDIYNGKNKTTCLVTSRPIMGNGINKGTVLLFNEISRAQKLVQRMSGARSNLTFINLIGEEPVFLETVELARKAADSTSNVLLLGESGTGKDVFAQAIHNTGIRNRGPFVALNCGAIPRELIASELFGYVEGAFTGASRGGKMGKFELANGGTIFLDEIGEMPLELQTSLLRVLETKTITRVSGNDVIPVDVRIIAATNKDLSLEVSQGKFRQDLYYRLNVFSIRILPLRERNADIALLSKKFLDILCTKFKKVPMQLDKKVLEVFNQYPWPGNIRELQNVLERIVNVCNDTIISINHLPVEMRSAKTRGSLMPIENYEKELIESLLELHNRNITRVANELGIARTTLYQKIAKYKL